MSACLAKATVARICIRCDEPFVVRKAGKNVCRNCVLPLPAMRDDWCDDCGCSHNEQDRQRRLGRLMPVSMSDARDALGHIYDGRQRMLERDLATLRRGQHYRAYGEQIDAKAGGVARRQLR